MDPQIEKGEPISIRGHSLYSKTYKIPQDYLALLVQKEEKETLGGEIT